MVGEMLDFLAETLTSLLSYQFSDMKYSIRLLLVSNSIHEDVEEFDTSNSPRNRKMYRYMIRYSHIVKENKF